MAQVAEGAMEEITTSLQRMRTLVVQAENGINASTDRKALQKEITALSDEITRIAKTTKFGDQNLLSGDSTDSTFDFLVGAQASTDDYIKVELGRTAGAEKGWGASSLGVNLAKVNVTISAGTGLPNIAGAANLKAIDDAIAAVDEKRADLGAVQNRFQATIRNLTNISENVAGARARIRDTDFAKETAELTRAQILQQTSQTVLAQANQRPQAALSLLG
ncbi:flagellin [Alishewanella longhuensis]